MQVLAAALAMLLTSIPALAAQSPDEVSEDPASAGQDRPAPVEPPAGTPGSVPGICEHAPGEFLVGYASEEALQAAPPENVVALHGDPRAASRLRGDKEHLGPG